VSSFDSKGVVLLFEKVVKEILDKIALQTELSTVSELKVTTLSLRVKSSEEKWRFRPQ
jgi:hypothetical protein